MDGMRIDKWLWFARFFKSRSLAGRVVEEGVVRLNGRTVAKPSQTVKAGDVLEFPVGPAARPIPRQVRVAALANRRGPADEARTLYADLSPSEGELPFRLTLDIRTSGAER